MGKQRTSNNSVAADSGRLLGIDEAEVNGYLNTKKEMLYKTMIWELMNKDSAKPKQPNNNKEKKKKEKKKDSTNKRVASEKLENEKKRKRLASKVNLDVFEKLMNDDQPERESELQPEKSVAVETQSCVEGDDGDGADDELEQYENEYNGDIVYRNDNVDYETDYNYEEDFDYEDY